MKIIQTIQLTPEEEKAIENTLSICDKISEVAHCSMEDVFRYFLDHSDIVDEYSYATDTLIQIADIS